MSYRQCSNIISLIRCIYIYIYIEDLGLGNEPHIGSGSHISGALLHDAGQLGYARDKSTSKFW